MQWLTHGMECVRVFRGGEMLCGRKLRPFPVPAGELPALQFPWHKIIVAGKSQRNETNPMKLTQDHMQEVGNLFTVFSPLLWLPHHCR